jgi:hypothetical protein
MDQGLEVAEGGVGLGVFQAVAGDLGDQHVAFVPPAVDRGQNGKQEKGSIGYHNKDIVIFMISKLRKWLEGLIYATVRFLSNLILLIVPKNYSVHFIIIQDHLDF